MTDQPILDRIGDLDLEGCKSVALAVENRQNDLELELAASFNVGDEVEYEFNSGTVLSIDGKYLGIRHDGSTSMFPSEYVHVTRVSLVIP